MTDDAAMPCTGSPRLAGTRLVRAGRHINAASHSFEARGAGQAGGGRAADLVWCCLLAFPGSADRGGDGAGDSHVSRFL